MFETLKNAWKVLDIRKKILYTLFIIVLFRLGSQIPVPFVDSSALAATFNSSGAANILGYFNLLSGGAISQATLFALSISPYITASIVVQLLCVAIPALEKLSKSGPEGQQKIQNYTRYLTIALALALSYGYYTTMKNQSNILMDKGIFPMIVILVSFTAGACLIMWLGERIDENGIGNGISLILFANILSSGPALILSIWEYLKAAFVDKHYTYLIWVVLVLVISLAAIFGVVFFTNAERRLPVQYAKRQVGRRIYGGNNTFLPLKLNMTGVMPIIFAQSIAQVPATLAMIIPSWSNGVEKWFSSASSFPFYLITYFVLIIAFAYFYSSISFNPLEVASNLQKNGGTILGYRPGRPTADHIRKSLSKITLIDAIFQSVIACTPILVTIVLKLIGTQPAQEFLNAFSMILAFGGTSLLILVGVALETTRTLEAQITMRNYKGFLE